MCIHAQYIPSPQNDSELRKSYVYSCSSIINQKDKTSQMMRHREQGLEELQT